MKTVSIIEDDDLIRESYAIIINGSEEFKLRSSYKSYEEFASTIEAPITDMILVDIGLPGLNGIAATKLIKKEWPQIEIIIISVNDDSKLIFEAMKNGASGFISKSSNNFELIQSLREIGEGQAIMNPKIAHLVMEYFPVSNETLALNETFILKLLSLGKTYVQIAQQLQITKEAVKINLSRIYKKLQSLS